MIASTDFAGYDGLRQELNGLHHMIYSPESAALQKSNAEVQRRFFHEQLESDRRYNEERLHSERLLDDQQRQADLEYRATQRESNLLWQFNLMILSSLATLVGLLVTYWICI